MTPAPATPEDLLAAVRERAIDPVPDRIDAEPLDATWFAEPGQWELGLLHRIVREGFAAATDVQFATNLGEVRESATFRIAADAPVRIRATGAVLVGEGTARDGDVDLSAGEHVLTVRTDGAPAGLHLLHGDADVAVRSPDGSWVPAAVGRGTASVPPHEVRNPVHALPMTREGDLFSLPAEVLGRVVVRARSEPRIVAGETPEEARSVRAAEQRFDLRRRDDGRWESVHELGLRYLVVCDVDVDDVVVEAAAFPAARRGAFACSDDRLTDIWLTSAFTLRQCAQGLILDGIKRDRMPWMGDVAVGMPAFAYAFGDAADIVERGLVALGQPRSGYVNGIVDYSLWWLICTADLLRFFDAQDHVRAWADHLDRFVERLAAEADERGILRPAPGADAYAKPVFIDWGVDVDPDEDTTALQVLWWWALRSAAAVLRSAEHAGADRWEALADRVRRTLLDEAKDADGGWRQHLGRPGAGSPYPELFAAVSGIEPVPAVVAERLRTGPRARTPFVTAFAVEALARAGHPDAAVQQIRERWGAMLDAGATTFWEEFPEPGASPTEMYGRPFGKSLCHAWAAGPARLLPEIVCGVRPTGPAWSTFEVDPHLGGLAWAGAVVPVPTGEIAVLCTSDGTTVHVPAGCALVHGGRTHPGPGIVRF